MAFSGELTCTEVSDATKFGRYIKGEATFIVASDPAGRLVRVVSRLARQAVHTPSRGPWRLSHGLLVRTPVSARPQPSACSWVLCASCIQSPLCVATIPMRSVVSFRFDRPYLDTRYATTLRFPSEHTPSAGRRRRRSTTASSSSSSHLAVGGTARARNLTKSRFYLATGFESLVCKDDVLTVPRGPDSLLVRREKFISTDDQT